MNTTIKEKVLMRLDPITIKPVITIDTHEQLEKELLNFSADYWTAAKLSGRGYNFEKIKKFFKDMYSLTEVEYMVRRVKNVNRYLAMSHADKDAEKYQMIDELNDLQSNIWEDGDIDSTNGRTRLNPQQYKLLLEIKRDKANLMGLNAPVKVESSLKDDIATAMEMLDEKINRYKADLAARKVIDITKSINEEEPKQKTNPTVKENLTTEKVHPELMEGD